MKVLYRNIKKNIPLSIFLFGYWCHVSWESVYALNERNDMSEPFSENEIIEPTRTIALKAPEFFHASDGLQLAYYSFVPTNPKAVVVFYHGGGAWSNKLYQYMARELSNMYNIAVYLFDIRGHGNSQGARGDAPSRERVWEDVNNAINFVHERHIHLPLFLSGHSAGGGLLLNHSYWKSAQTKNVKGYILFAPFLGPNTPVVKKYRVSPSRRFVSKVRRWVFALNIISNRILFNHTPAVFFNYTDEQKRNDPLLISSYTCAMALALTPWNVQSIFEHLEHPCALFVGSLDEAFSPEKLVTYKSFLQEPLKERSISTIIPSATHLSIMVAAASYLSRAIDNFLAGNSH